MEGKRKSKMVIRFNVNPNDDVNSRNTWQRQEDLLGSDERMRAEAGSRRVNLQRRSDNVDDEYMATFADRNTTSLASHAKRRGSSNPGEGHAIIIPSLALTDGPVPSAETMAMVLSPDPLREAHSRQVAKLQEMGTSERTFSEISSSGRQACSNKAKIVSTLCTQQSHNNHDI